MPYGQLRQLLLRYSDDDAAIDTRCCARMRHYSLCVAAPLPLR